MRDAAFAALVECDPQRKCDVVLAIDAADLDASRPAFDWQRVPGRPQRPSLVHPREVPRRALGSREGRCALLHAVAHIEFNAINLALDAVCRFDGLPDAYYGDWLSVAIDEARHFRLLRMRLQQLGHDYGDFTAHNGLWEAAEKTAHDPMLRMALVPRRVDLTPGMMHRVREAGDTETLARPCAACGVRTGYFSAKP